MRSPKDLAVVLRGGVCVGITFVAVNSPVFLHASCNDVGKVEWFRKIAPNASPPSEGAVGN